MLSQDPSAAVGDYTLLAKRGDGISVSVASADSAATVWKDFESDGSLDGGVATDAYERDHLLLLVIICCCRVCSDRVLVTSAGRGRWRRRLSWQQERRPP